MAVIWPANGGRVRSPTPIRPGPVTYAIPRLVRTDNTAPTAERQRLELEYVARRSLWIDVRRCTEAVAAASRGSAAARGWPPVKPHRRRRGRRRCTRRRRGRR
jgi:hypothetical protein